MRWSSSEREECLAARTAYWQERDRQENGGRHHSDQWPRIPSDAIASLINAVHEQANDMLGTKNGSSLSLTIPRSAYRYLSIVPVGKIEGRRETQMGVNDSFDFRLAMAAANSHVGSHGGKCMATGLM